MKQPPATIPVTDRLAALGEMVRLRVLRLLEAEELAVGEVAQVVQLPQSTVSRHLKVLADGGWITKRNEGTATFYRLHLDDLAPDARALWRTVREQLGDSGDLAEDQRRLRAVLDERKTDSETFFGRAGGEWDQIRAEMFGDRFTSLALLSLINPRWSVADLGCGTGNASELIAPVVARVIAVDQSDVMLAAAKRRLSAFKTVEFANASLDRLPLRNGEIDAALCLLVLHHLDQPLGALREMRRTVSPRLGGGIAIVVDMVKHDRDLYRRTMGHRHLGFSKDEMSRLMSEAGFDQVSYRELPGEPEGKGPGLFVCVGRITKENT